jgi:hypothetical protein
LPIPTTFPDPQALETKTRTIDVTPVHTSRRQKKTTRQVECVQDWFTKHLQLWNGALGNRQLHDTHSASLAGFDGKRPDAGLFDRVRNLFRLLMWIELKAMGYGTDGFRDEERGEIIEYAELTLRKQTWRVFLFSVLWDGRFFEIVRSSRLADKSVLHEWVADGDATVPGAAGWGLLSRLLTLSATEIGYDLPVLVDDLQLKDFLGSGLSADVFEGTDALSGRFVVKVYRSSEDFEREKTVLARLAAGNVEHVPSVVRSTTTHDGRAVLVMQPLAQHFDFTGIGVLPRLRESDIRLLVNVLRQAHCLGLVHRDVRFDNIYFFNSKVLLNDWGAAVGTCSAVDYIGVAVELSPFLIAHKSTVFVPRSQDDLHALARSLYRQLYRPPHHLFHSADGTPDIARIEAFWRQLSNTWQNIFQLAEDSCCTDEASYLKFAQALVNMLEGASLFSWPHIGQQ